MTLRHVALLGVLLPSVAHAAQILHRGNQVEPENLDPHRATGVSSSNILRDLYEGLTSEAPDGTVVPGAAGRWDISDDGTVYTFHLRADARWSNGDPVTAGDFVSGLRRTVDPKTGSEYSQVLAPIVNAEDIIAGRKPADALAVDALDERTLRVQLIGPTPYFLGLLNHSSTYPIHGPSLETHGAAFARPGRLVSNGAYRLEEWVVQSHVKLVRNPEYWGAASVAIDAVYYYPTENLAAELKRYRAGELDWTYDVPVTQARWVRENLPDEFEVAPYLGIYYFGFNVTKPPFRDNPALRQALTMAIDREIIADRIVGTGEVPAYGWVPPVVNYTPQRPDWADWPRAQRLAEARRLYAEAGYGPDNPLETEIRYNTQENHKRVSIAIAFMWKQALGVKTRLVNEEWKVYLQNRRFKHDTQVFRAGWIGDYNDAMNFAELMHSDHGVNDSGYDNPEYDALLAKIAVETDENVRRAMLEEAERMILRDLPIMPVYFYVSRRLVKPYVKGWAPNIMDHHYTKNMSLEKR